MCLKVIITMSGQQPRKSSLKDDKIRKGSFLDDVPRKLSLFPEDRPRKASLLAPMRRNSEVRFILCTKYNIFCSLQLSVLILTNWLLRNPEVHHRLYISSSFVPNFSKISQISNIITHLPQVHFNIILLSTSRPS